MKNLVPLKRKMFYWDEIVKNKHNASKLLLQGLRASIDTRVKLYTRLSTSLELMPTVIYTKDIETLLRGCYSSSTNLSVLKAKIIENQEVILRAECQYCNIGEPSTFDHYLPQASFPEFSAISINLIPCCPKCNTAKGEEWLRAGKRKVVNLYYDVLPTNTYLICQILYKNNVPQAKFTIDINEVATNFRDTIRTHYSTLHLLKRYRERGNSEIVDVLSAISPQVGRLTRQQIKNSLIQEANQMKQRRGPNYWRAAVRLGLANSDQFLANAGF